MERGGMLPPRSFGFRGVPASVKSRAGRAQHPLCGVKWSPIRLSKTSGPRYDFVRLSLRRAVRHIETRQNFISTLPERKERTQRQRERTPFLSIRYRYSSCAGWSLRRVQYGDHRYAKPECHHALSSIRCCCSRTRTHCRDRCSRWRPFYLSRLPTSFYYLCWLLGPSVLENRYTIKIRSSILETNWSSLSACHAGCLADHPTPVGSVPGR